jgi:hypothetical protein
MAQHDFNIANQSFPSFRTDLNNALSAINTSQSGTSRPSGAVAGTIWLDTTSATTPTLKYYDGADDISLATLDHSANTVNWLDSTVSVTGLSTTATGTVLTLTDSDTSSSVNLILQNQKEIRFGETTANGVNYVGFKAPASLSADKIWVLPSADGTAGQFLKTDGAGNLSFDSLSFATPLAVIGNATAGSEIRLPEDTDNGSNYVAIKAPDTLASNLTLTLPSADGSSGQVLQTNGSGVLSFAGVSASAGQVIQVLSTTKQDTFSVSTASGTFNDVTGLSVSITPSSASNKILIICHVVGAIDADDNRQFIMIKRNGSQLLGASGTASGNRISTITIQGQPTTPGGATHFFNFLDSPSSTSSLTYQIAMAQGTGVTKTIYVNRSSDDDNQSYIGRAASTITVMEIKG